MNQNMWNLETPPRAWGRRQNGDTARSQQGNTPTCVGKTYSGATETMRAWKHPHVRGEDKPIRAMESIKTETPPRAWGRPVHMITSGCSHGNTPTCVGKTHQQTSPRRQFRKHPHVRGEDLQAGEVFSVVKETPPRAWGRLLRDIRTPFMLGNTPTCVGKTQAQGPLPAYAKKHPHVRGEDNPIDGYGLPL